MLVVGYLSLPFVQRGLLEVLFLAVAAGALGPWIILRGLAFFTHAVGTAAFPGLVLASGLGFAPVLGAYGVAVLFAGSLEVLRRRRGDRIDSTTAIVLVGALAGGVILASDVFASRASVDSLLFGSLLLVAPGDLLLAAVTAVGVTVVALFAARAWLATGFDPERSGSGGRRSRVPDLLLYGAVALAAIATLAAVGALLTAALLIVPAATTRLVVRHVGRWQMATGLLAAVEGAAGLLVATELNLPPGPTITVLAGSLFALVAVARTRAAAAAVAAAAAAVLLAGCGATDDDDRAVAGPRIVATTALIADWASAVAGDRADVHAILAANADPHTYEPRPHDLLATAAAAVVIANGLGFDDWIEPVAEQAGFNGRRLDLSAGMPVRRGDDPHWWNDPRNAESAVRQIRDALVAADPGGVVTYRRNADAYLARVRALDAAIAACLATIPPGQRTLVSDHDAFGYLAGRYRITVVGAVLGSGSGQAQPSAADLAALVETVRRERVRAVFGEEALSPDLVRQLARETGARADLTLYGDGLGLPGSPGGTYLGMMAANASALATGFAGERRECG